MKHFLFFKFSLIVFILFAVVSSFLAGKVYAANAVPAPPMPFPCNQDTGTGAEFSSDRPYQASNCGDRPITYWCGNKVVVDLGSVKVNYCDPSGQATSCPADITRTQKIDIDLTNVTMPFLGNTQLTKNSQNATDQIDDGTKVSNYVAWYLGGTNAKAEYGNSDPGTIEGISKIIDTSGPIKKLLPSVIQDASRINAIANASTNVTYTPEGEGAPTETVPSTTEPENHNQIVVCYEKPVSVLPSWLTNFLGTGAVGLGKAKAIPCYSGGGSAPQGSLLRLKNWDNTPFDVASTAIRDWILQYHLYPVTFLDEIISSAADHWPEKIPPLPWKNEFDKPFANVQDYQKAYNEWRGQLCAYITLPILGKQLVCIGIPGVTNNDYADLYQYVPLANTADKQGSHLVTDTHLDIPKATFDCPGNVCYKILHIFGLKIPHTAEDYQLTQELKSTYVPATASGATKVGLFPAATLPNDVENNNSTCRIIPSRTNSGDDVVFDNKPSHAEVDVQYHVSEIQCTTPQWTCTHLGRGPDFPETCKWTANCESQVYATISTISKTPFADEIWKNTVAGSDSIFRRIYPKTGPNTPVSCIADTPASSNATYTLSPASSNGLNLLRVNEPDGSAVSGGGGAQSIDAQLYYPHFGAVGDYFLTGIQQALRPQGYGEGTPINGQFCGNLACGELPKTLPKAAGSCKLTDTSKLNVPVAFRSILEAAGQTYNVPPSLILGVMFGEGAFNKGRYAWTDANVKNWATCQRIPNCSPGGNLINSVVPYYSSNWNSVAKQILPDLRKIDPTKTHADPCNIIDITYGLAKDLSTGKYGGSFGINSCFGIPLNTGSSGTSGCSWNSSDYESAIKVWENGYEPGCFTKENSCATGGGNSALCPTGGDSCERINNRYQNPSHNACVWDVATSGSGGNRR